MTKDVHAEGSVEEQVFDELEKADAETIIEEDIITYENNEEEPFEDIETEDEADTVLIQAKNNDFAAKPEISDEELDQIADTAIETLREILSFFDAENSAIDEYEGDEAELILDVVGDDLAILIGRYGKTLDALQYIVASIVNKKIGYHYPIAVDIEGYRNRRRQKLEALAKSAAARCIRNKKEVRLNPMTPYERRIIHIILREEKRVETVSEGTDPKRQVVVRPR